MKVVYLHGWLSSPLSYKVQVLRENGFQVLAPELPAEDWGQSVINARKAIKEFAPDVVVGSSRGGAVAMASNKSTPAILIAPAWKKFCPWGTIAASTTIIHSPDDEVVAFDDSVELAHTFGAMLVEAGQNHRMQDDEAIGAILEALNEYR
jgi:predicted esterase YcpF (UPF0227 family)|tara:strand:- start:1127 stop:1576 length:450 start_codon:yes stop_codon:yes gene_type:complete